MASRPGSAGDHVPVSSRLCRSAVLRHRERRSLGQAHRDLGRSPALCSRRRLFTRTREVVARGGLTCRCFLSHREPDANFYSAAMARYDTTAQTLWLRCPSRSRIAPCASRTHSPCRVARLCSRKPSSSKACHPADDPSGDVAAAARPHALLNYLTLALDAVAESCSPPFVPRTSKDNFLPFADL